MKKWSVAKTVMHFSRILILCITLSYLKEKFGIDIGGYALVCLTALMWSISTAFDD